MAVSKLRALCFLAPENVQPRQRSPLPRLCFSPSKNPLPLLLKTPRLIPVSLPKLPTIEKDNIATYSQFTEYSSDSLSVVFPALAFSNTLFFSSTYNIQLVPGDNEPEERLINRFRREVLRAGVIQECKRRRFFESTQEKRKRKTREAQRRNRKRRPQPRVPKEVKAEGTKKKYDSDDDNWEIVAVG